MIPADQAVEALVHEYYKLVFHTIYGLTASWEESQDLTQETFQQALKGIDAARASSGSQFHARAWILRIALNTVRMQRRRRALFHFIPFSHMQERNAQDTDHDRDASAEFISAQAAPVQPGGYGSTLEESDPAERVAEQDTVQRAMAKVPEPLRLCLLLSIVGGLSNAEIASTLELQESAVRKRLERARKQFRDAYEYESGESIIDTASDTKVQHKHSQTRKRGTEQTPSSALSDTSQRLTLTVGPSMPWRSYV